MEESTASSSQAAKALASLGGRARSCQIPEPTAVPAGGARGWMSRRRQQQPRRVRSTEKMSYHSSAGRGWASFSGLWQPHVASSIPTCCSNRSSLKLLASLSLFHKPSLDSRVVYLNLLNGINIFLKKV